MPPSDDDTGALEQARKRLYDVGGVASDARRPLSVAGDRVLPHSWGDGAASTSAPPQKSRHLHFAGGFFAVAFLFFMVSLGVAGYFFYSGGNTVSVDKIDLDIQGPSTIAGGDTVPLLLTITNTNPVAIKDTTVEITFPEGTRDADNTLEAYPRYTENLGTIASGATVTRSLKAVIFGGAGEGLTLPISLSYGTAGSNAVFVKKDSYDLSISSAPLEVSVDALTETVSGKPLTLTLKVRSNSKVSLSNVVLAGTFPFGFTVDSSSVPLSNSSFLLGTLTPGQSRTITLTGRLAGQDGEQRVFHFSVGTAKTASDQALAVTYMSQDKTVGITAPFINTTLSLNGDSSPNAVVPAGSRQSVTVSYVNTLPTSVSNVNVSIAVSGGAVDYRSIESARGFYRSIDRTVVFSQDREPSLANLAPGASGIGTFSFATLSAGALASPSITFTISVSGTRVGQSNVPEQVSASVTKTVKVVTAVALSSYALHSSGPLSNTGPVPPLADQATTYSVVWNVKNQGSAIADGTVVATLPSYVTYTGKTAGSGTFSYDTTTRKVSWNAGDLAQGTSAQGVFQVSITPSTSQSKSAPSLTTIPSFSGYDRFAGVQVRASADPATTETSNDPGFVRGNGEVQ